MKLIITSSIREIEMAILEPVFSLDTIKICAKKSLLGLGDTIKSSFKIKGTCLKKIDITSPGGAGRVVFLLQIGLGKAVLVTLKPKKDKKIGMNMTIKNPNFKNLLSRNLDLILKDLVAGNYIEYDV